MLASSNALGHYVLAGLPDEQIEVKGPTDD